MEIELKYGIDNNETFEELWHDVALKKMEIEGTREVKSMVTYYLDTEDYKLMDKKIAIRIRDDGDKFIATLKTLVKAVGHIHKREEIETILPKFPKEFTINLFNFKDIGIDLKELVGEEKLIVIMETQIERSLFLLDYEKSRVEVALDKGKIKAKGKESPIREMELELVSGPESELLSLGNTVMGKYKLKPEPKSKFERGLQLLEKC